MRATEHKPAGEAPVFEPAQGGSRLGDILADLYRNVFDLVQGEVKLAGAEISSILSRQIKRSLLVAVGTSIAFAGFLFVLAACAIALSSVMPAVWAALVVGIPVLLTGTIIMLIGSKKLGEADFIPRRAIDTMGEDAKWMRDQLM